MRRGEKPQEERELGLNGSLEILRRSGVQETMNTEDEYDQCYNCTDGQLFFFFQKMKCHFKGDLGYSFELL